MGGTLSGTDMQLSIWYINNSTRKDSNVTEAISITKSRSEAAFAKLVLVS